MSDTAKQLWAKIWPIFLSAGCAAGLTFIQSISAHAGFCPAPIATPQEAGLLSAAIHTSILSARYLTGGTV